MDWHCFGHATWLAEIGGTRVLFDPLIDGLHHGDVFEVEPRRRVNVPAIEADFLVVSHAHGDHFDLPSLYALAKADPDTVVLTSDPIIARATKRLGFARAEVVETWARVDLGGGGRLLTTPSYAEGETEWGILITGDDTAVWNQVDSYHPDPATVQQTLAEASRRVERDVTDGLPLAMVRWQPVLETAAVLARGPGFPFDEYARSLARIAEVRAKTVIPSAAGVRQTAPYAWMNHYVYPVPHRRAERDIVARAPGTRVLTATIGATFHVIGSDVTVDARGARHLVEPLEDFDPNNTVFRPYEMPALVDPNPSRRGESAMRATVTSWVEGALAHSLAASYRDFQVRRPLSLVLEVVYPASRDVFTITVSDSGASVSRTFDDDHDVINTVAGSLLADVIEGHRSWGDPLLGGMIRAASRAYDLDETGLLISGLVPTFVYYGIPYEQSVERAIEYQLGQLLG